MRLLWIVILLSSLAYGLTTPIWPLYIEELGASMTELGYLISLSNALTATLQIPSGWVSDRYGRRKIHILGSILAILPPLAYALVRNWIELISWVALSGLSIGLYNPVRASIIADETDSEGMAMTYGWINVSWLIGSMGGPILSGFLADILGIRVSFILCFLLLSTSLPLVLSIQETGRKRRSREDVARRGWSKRSASTALIFSSINLLQGVAFGVFFTITPVFLSEIFSASFFYIGLVNAIGFGLASIIAQILGGIWATRYDKKALLVAATMVSAPFYALLVFSQSVTVYLLYIFLANLSLTLSWPAFQELMMNAVHPLKRGFMNGLAATSYWAGMMVGSASSGVIWDMLGAPIPYCLASLTIFLSAIPALFIKSLRETVNL
ncbi:MAG: MFS transporter [Candidatus Freyarchaeota archaeon]